MKKRWRFLFCFSAVSILLLVLGNSQILANDSATVVATVQTELISLTTSVSSLDYGLIQYGLANDLIDSVTVTNNGNVSEDIKIRGSDAVERNDLSKKWVLTTDVTGENLYKHAFSLTGATSVYFSKDSDTVVQSAVVAGGTVPDLHMKLVAPTTGSYSGIFDTNVYFIAVKS